MPVHDLESGEVVGERPRWEALAPYVGIPIATAAIFGVEAFAPAIAAWLGLSGSAAEVVTNAARGAASEARVLRWCLFSKFNRPIRFSPIKKRQSHLLRVS